MPARKMRVELFDSDGNRYTIAFEGQVTREKAVRLLDLVELLGGVPKEEANTRTRTGIAENGLSKYDKVRTIVQRSFPIVWFSSKEVQNAYEQELGEPIGLSTVATYLSRLVLKEVLVKNGPLNNLKYKIVQGVSQAHMKQAIS
ncbi:MAG: hypothetical protein ABSC91_08375 [Candidatus Bathyarchaeia archaeon]|jgi:hypothetical protein